MPACLRSRRSSARAREDRPRPMDVWQLTPQRSHCARHVRMTTAAGAAAFAVLGSRRRNGSQKAPIRLCSVAGRACTCTFFLGADEITLEVRLIGMPLRDAALERSGQPHRLVQGRTCPATAHVVSVHPHSMTAEHSVRPKWSVSAKKTVSGVGSGFKLPLDCGSTCMPSQEICLIVLSTA